MGQVGEIKKPQGPLGLDSEIDRLFSISGFPCFPQMQGNPGGVHLGEQMLR